MNEEIILLFRKELQNLGYCESVVNFYPKTVQQFLEYGLVGYQNEKGGVSSGRK